MIDKDDLALIAHCIAVANGHSAPDDYVKLVVDAGFPFNAAAAFPIIQEDTPPVIDEVWPIGVERPTSVTTPLIQVY